MVATHHHSCTLCQATCGIIVTTDGDRVIDIRGDQHDPISQHQRRHRRAVRRRAHRTAALSGQRVKLRAVQPAAV